ncbi:MAG: TIGR01244 family sulfur transferase [Pseudomonadota bacterium]
MDLRWIVDGYAVAPQLTPSDMSTLAAQGVKTVICNRPDSEVPPDLQAAEVQKAAELAGLVYIYNPVVGFGMSPDAIDEQADAIDSSDGPVVAYCASGMRSALMWALAKAGTAPAEEILAKVAAAGYRMDHLVGQIEGVGQTRR